MLDHVCYEELPDIVKLRVGEVTIRAGQLDNALTVAIFQAGSKTLADAFACAKNLQNRETILDESARSLRRWAGSNGVDCDVDTIIERAKTAYRLRDQSIAERCFMVDGEGDSASRRHWPEMPFDLEQLRMVAQEIHSIVKEISAMDGPAEGRQAAGGRFSNSQTPAVIAQQGQLIEPRGFRTRFSPKRLLHSLCAAFPFIPPV